MLKSRLSDKVPELQQLPWHEYAGSSRGEGGMKKELSGAHLLIALGIIGLAISTVGWSIVQFSRDFSPSAAARIAPRWVGSAIVFAGIILWGVWLQWGKRRENPQYPDVLGKLFPRAHLMEAEAVQLAAFAFQHAKYVRVVVVAQNRYDGPCDLRVNFSGGVAQPLAVKLPGGGVIMAWKDEMANLRGGGLRTRFGVEAESDGKLVRTIRRNLFGRNSMQRAGSMLTKGGIARGIAAGMGAGGHSNAAGEIVFADLAGVLPLDVAAPKADAPVAPDLSGKWSVKPLWTTTKPATLPDQATMLASLLGAVLLSYQFPFKWTSADAIDALHKV